MNFLEELKKYFETHSKEEIQETWEKYNTPENNIGVTVNDFLEFNKNHNINWKPNAVKTGVCNFQKCPFTHYCFMNNKKIMCNVCGNLVGGNNITC